jgi:hypothetical protein
MFIWIVYNDRPNPYIHRCEVISQTKSVVTYKNHGEECRIRMKGRTWVVCPTADHAELERDLFLRRKIEEHHENIRALQKYRETPGVIEDISEPWPAGPIKLD